VFEVSAQETLAEIVEKKNENRNFIQLKSGEIFYFDSYIEKTNPFLGSSKLKVLDQEFKLADVDYYKTGTQFFANTDRVIGACTDVAERIDVGKINIYRSFQTVYNAGAPMMGAGGMMMSYGGGASTKEVFYYTKGTSPLKSMNYNNLAEDLVENQESMILLQTYKKAENRKVLWYVIGGAAFLGGAITGFEKTGETNTGYNFETGRTETVDEVKIKPLNFSIAVAGMITIAVNYLTHRKNGNYLKQAVYSYNK
jgi:hypothetical protein